MKWLLRIALDEFHYLEAHELENLDEAADAYTAATRHEQFRDRIHKPNDLASRAKEAFGSKVHSEESQGESKAKPTETTSTCSICNDGKVRITKQGTNKGGPWYLFGCTNYKGPDKGCQGAGPSWEMDPETLKSIIPF